MTDGPPPRLLVPGVRIPPGAIGRLNGAAGTVGLAPTLTAGPAPRLPVPGVRIAIGVVLPLLVCCFLFRSVTDAPCGTPEIICGPTEVDAPEPAPVLPWVI